MVTFNRRIGSYCGAARCQRKSRQRQLGPVLKQAAGGNDVYFAEQRVPNHVAYCGSRDPGNGALM